MRTGVVAPIASPTANASQTARAWRECDGTRRIWAADASLWTGADENTWLAWLTAPSDCLARLSQWQEWAEVAQRDGIEDVIVLGMGGSSLCPEVLAQTFGPQPGAPRLRVLDSTVPAQVRELEASIDLARSLFVVSSKSGTTIEANVLLEHFFSALQASLPSARASDAGRHFIAITDRDTPLEALARSQGFRQLEYGVAAIGGRFSALSPFGMLPATLAGLDTGELLRRAQQMAERCRLEGADDNPGAELGIAIAAHARAGRDKLTLVASPGLAALGTWLEQLVAESTGKAGLGIIPIVDESLDAPESYGDDRLFVYARVQTEGADAAQDAAVAALERAGQPVVRLEVPDLLELAAEFYRWEFAIAVAGSLLGVHPFNQPDVEAAKVAARELTDRFVTTGALPHEPPLSVQQGVALFADPAFALEPGWDLAATLAAHFERIAPGDYFALTAFVALNPRNQAALRRICRAVRSALPAATTLGFGPRFLHSTGQLHKGGPNSGVFLQITGDDAADLDMPQRDFSFGVLKTAQALGDFQVLCQRGRRVLRLHLGSEVASELERIAESAERAAQQLETRRDSLDSA